MRDTLPSAPGVHFCEEYPDPETLEHARLIRSPAIVFLAAESPSEFERARGLLAAINPDLRSGWWLVPRRTRALSVFCEPAELTPLTEGLESMPPGSVLLDLELPVWEPRRLLRSPNHLRSARRELARLFAAALARHDVWSAEWPPALPPRLLRWLGICLPQANMRVYMLYSSILPGWWRNLLLSRLHHRLAATRSGIGVGVLATGIAGDERLLSVEGFEADLQEAAALGAAAVIVYRLGGLEERHVVALERVAAKRDIEFETAGATRSAT